MSQNERPGWRSQSKAPPQKRIIQKIKTDKIEPNLIRTHCENSKIKWPRWKTYKKKHKRKELFKKKKEKEKPRSNRTQSSSNPVKTSQKPNDQGEETNPNPLQNRIIQKSKKKKEKTENTPDQIEPDQIRIRQKTSQIQMTQMVERGGEPPTLLWLEHPATERATTGRESRVWQEMGSAMQMQTVEVVPPSRPSITSE